MSWGDNGKARPSTEAYRNSPYWDAIEAKKKAEKIKKAEEVRAHHEEEAKIGQL
jgi:hypothetical protein